MGVCLGGECWRSGGEKLIFVRCHDAVKYNLMVVEPEAKQRLAGALELSKSVYFQLGHPNYSP